MKYSKLFAFLYLFVGGVASLPSPPVAVLSLDRRQWERDATRSSDAAAGRQDGSERQVTITCRSTDCLITDETVNGKVNPLTHLTADELHALVEALGPVIPSAVLPLDNTSIVNKIVKREIDENDPLSKSNQDEGAKDGLPHHPAQQSNHIRGETIIILDPRARRLISSKKDALRLGGALAALGVTGGTWYVTYRYMHDHEKSHSNDAGKAPGPARAPSPQPRRVPQDEEDEADVDGSRESQVQSDEHSWEDKGKEGIHEAQDDGKDRLSSRENILEEYLLTPRLPPTTKKLIYGGGILALGATGLGGAFGYNAWKKHHDQQKMMDKQRAPTPSNTP